MLSFIKLSFVSLITYVYICIILHSIYVPFLHNSKERGKCDCMGFQLQ